MSIFTKEAINFLNSNFHVEFRDNHLNEVEPEQATEIHLYTLTYFDEHGAPLDEPTYDWIHDVEIKRFPKTVTVEWLQKKINTDKVYESFAPKFAAFLKKQNIEGYVYPTTYGIGVGNLFSDEKEIQTKIENLLNSIGIEFRTQMSQALFVKRFLISKSKKNIAAMENFEPNKVDTIEDIKTPLETNNNSLAKMLADLRNS